MNPMENDGVDFWWIDWQQGTGDKDAVDPLFLLNHYHYKDQEGRNIRPMIFSRYAGPGSHRYPVGFSGDTVSSWRSLDIQPYFTSTSSNIGYGWWSHDIGGHMLGDKDDERLVRWIEYGVFSPIMRLHSSNSEFLNKEPWEIAEPFQSVIKKFLRLRHALLPYTYTETYRAYKDDKPLIRPMYYDYMDAEASYHVPNEYGFGESLIVGAITEPEDKKIKIASVNMYIPEGRWYDLFNGRIYDGQIKRKLYRNLDEIPVLLKAGGIVPMSLEYLKNGTDNPNDIRLCVGAGADGSYTMYEDDGKSMAYQNGQFVTTLYNVSWNNNRTLIVDIEGSKGNQSLIPNERRYEIKIYGVKKSLNDFAIDINGEKSSVLYEFDEYISTLTIFMPNVKSAEGSKICISGLELSSNDYKHMIFNLLKNSWLEIVTKDVIYNVMNSMSKDDFINWLKGENYSEVLKDAIQEVCGN